MNHILGKGSASMLVGLLICSACGPGEALEHQRQRLHEEHAETIAELDRIEARLLAMRSVVRTWEFLGERHERISEIACANAVAHAEAMDQSRERLARRTQELRQKKIATVASAVSDTRERTAPSNN